MISAPSAGRRFSTRHVVSGLAFTVLAAAALGDLWSDQNSFWDDSGPGASFFPLLLALLLAALGIAFACKRPAPVAASEETEGGGDALAARPQTIKFVGLLVALILAFPYLGGLISLSLFVVAEMIWIERSKTWISLVTGCGTFVGVWLVFVKLLAVPLPVGILPASFG